MPWREKPRLSDLENTLMSVIWKQGQATAHVVGVVAALKRLDGQNDSPASGGERLPATPS